MGNVKKWTGGPLCLILALLFALTGCVDQRKEVMNPKYIGEQNDPDWKIQKEPARLQQPGSSQR